MGKQQDFIRQTLIVFISRSYLLGANFGVSLLLARGLGATNRGVYALAVLIASFVGQTVSFGVNGAAVYFVGQRRYPMYQITSTLFWAGLFVGTGSAILTFCVLWLWGHVPIASLLLALIALPFVIWCDLLGHAFLGANQAQVFSLIGIIQISVLLIAQGVGFIWLRGNADLAVLGWAVSYVVAAAYAVFKLGRKGHIRAVLNWPLLKDAVKFSAPGYITNWLQFFNYRLDQMLLYVWVGPTLLGQYAIAVSMTEAMWQLPTSVSAVLFSHVASFQGSVDSVSTSRIARLTCVIMLGIALSVAIVAGPLVTFFFGAEYADSVPALRALLPGTVAMVLPKVIGGDLYGRGLPRYVAYGAAITSLVTIMGDVLLIPSWGIAGAGIASSLAYLVYGAVMLILMQRVSKERWVSFLWPTRDDFRWLAVRLVQSISTYGQKGDTFQG